VRVERLIGHYLWQDERANGIVGIIFRDQILSLNEHDYIGPDR
jgi:hypothetical protein